MIHVKSWFLLFIIIKIMLNTIKVNVEFSPYPPSSKWPQQLSYKFFKSNVELTLYTEKLTST